MREQIEALVQKWRSYDKGRAAPTEYSDCADDLEEVLATPAPVSGGEGADLASALWETAQRLEGLFDGKFAEWHDRARDCRRAAELLTAPPSPGSEGADPMHKAASDTAPDAGHVKGTGGQAGEVAAVLKELAAYSDNECARAAEALIRQQASALAQARAECERLHQSLAALQAEHQQLVQHASKQRERIERLREALREAEEELHGLRADTWESELVGTVVQDRDAAAYIAKLDALLARIDTLLASGGEGGT